jgi:tetratricopeptide (TPR) repeat protein
VAIEETSWVQDQPTEVRARRAGVVAGVGLVWAAFLGSLGFFLFAGLAVLAAAGIAAWALGARVPRIDVASVLARATGAGSAFACRIAPASATAYTGARALWSTAAHAGTAGTRHVSATAVRAVRLGVRGISSATRTGFSRAAGGARRISSEAATAGRRGALNTRPALREATAHVAATASAAKGRLDRPRPRPATVPEQLARDSTYLRRQGRIAEAVDAAEEAVALFDSEGDSQGRALASNSLGIALSKAGRHAEAIDAFDKALALLADAGDRHHEGQVLVNLGAVHRRVGGTEAARFCWVRALERLEPGTPESERTAELLGVR